MQNIKIIKIALIPAVSLLFALSPFSKAHADLISSQWTTPYYTPTQTGLSGPVVPEGTYSNDETYTLQYCINEERYQANVTYKSYYYYKEGSNGERILVNNSYATRPDGQYVNILKYERPDGFFDDVKISPDDAKLLGFSVNPIPKEPGVVSYSNNCQLQNYAQASEILPYSDELVVEYCPSGETVGGEQNGSTQRVGNILNYFRNNSDGTQSFYLKLAFDGSYVPYNDETYPRVAMWGRQALSGTGLVDLWGGTWQQGSEKACAPVKSDVPDYSQAPAFVYNQYGKETCPAGQTIGGQQFGGTERWGTIPYWTGRDKNGMQTEYFADGITGALTQINLYNDYPELLSEPYALNASVIYQFHGEWGSPACAPVQEIDLSTPAHFDHYQYIYANCPAGQTLDGVEGGNTTKQGTIEIWSATDKNGNYIYSIKDGLTGELTPINMADYQISTPPFFEMPSDYMEIYHGQWTFGSDKVCKVPVTYTYESEYQTVDCPEGMSGSVSQSRLVKKGSDGSVSTLLDWYTIMSSCQLPEPEQPVITEPEQPEQPVEPSEPEEPVTPVEPSEPETPVTPEPAWIDGGNASVSFTCPAGQVIGSVMGNGNVRNGLIPVLVKGSEFAYKAADGSAVPVVVVANEDGSISLPNAIESDVSNYGGKWLSGSEESCGEPSQFQAMTDWKTETVVCAEAQTGHITYDYNRTWDYDAKKDITKNDSGWVSSVRENTCKDLEDALLEEEEITKTEQCPDGQYGTIKVTGKVVTYGLSGSKFIETDRKNYCVAELDQFSQETQSKDCPSGQVGSISEYRIKAINNDGVESYPYGDTWLQASNTCANPVAADSDSTGETDKAKGLLSNQTLKASDNVNLDKLLNYLNVVQGVSHSSDFKLNIVLDTFDNINTGKIEAVATKWKQVSGGKVVLGDAPRFAKNYVGYGGITNSNAANFVIISANYNNGNIKVVAKEMSKMKASKSVTFNVPFAKI
ncbi:hypothetical protein [Pseudomonas rhodesiae]|uniref:hypothetical protein n=1 Tax=Pseudomonas rhodesiae TaxID=76760 RepID=UPI0024E0406C|nr:hypothetical protein [Pseudomonas rhodesiae]WHT80224.1 hypothetical protein QMY54_05043 [Pseudomonas rhodesiae]